MPAFTAASPGKIILFGEHAVVYGEPAIAVPVSAVQARAVVSADLSGEPGEIQFEAPDINLSAALGELDPDHPLRAAVAAAAGEDRLGQIPACRIEIRSTIPPSSGLGSSAAVSAAVIRAFSAFLGQRLSDAEVSSLIYEVEKIHHGTPSGIDNSVVVYQKPVFYQLARPLEFLTIPSPFELLIADSGLPGNTRQAVAEVRARWKAAPEESEQIFARIGRIAQTAKELLSAGRLDGLGSLMNENQNLLHKLGVSTPELDRLLESARKAGAQGAKLSGGGLGGHIIILPGEEREAVESALQDAGTTRILGTTIGN